MQYCVGYNSISVILSPVAKQLVYRLSHGVFYTVISNSCTDISNSFNVHVIKEFTRDSWLVILRRQCGPVLRSEDPGFKIHSDHSLIKCDPGSP